MSAPAGRCRASPAAKRQQRPRQRRRLARRRPGRLQSAMAGVRHRCRGRGLGFDALRPLLRPDHFLHRRSCRRATAGTPPSRCAPASPSTAPSSTASSAPSGASSTTIRHFIDVLQRHRHRQRDHHWRTDRRRLRVRAHRQLDHQVRVQLHRLRQQDRGLPRDRMRPGPAAPRLVSRQTVKERKQLAKLGINYKFGCRERAGRARPLLMLVTAGASGSDRIWGQGDRR